MAFIDPITTTAALGLAGAIFAVLAQFLQRKFLEKSSDAVREAEKQAYIDVPSELEERLQDIARSQDGLEEKAGEIAKLISESKEAVSVGRLFNLYSKQIEQYQQETRSRATWSFAFAIVAMLAGFGFVIWGGTVLLTASETIALASGGLLSTIGGAVSGYITKTFLDVHKLSLSQLNRYFQQPVINDHILMAQRLAEDCDDMETKKKAYEMIIISITKIIDSKGTTTNYEANK